VLGLHNARQLIHDNETIIVDGTRGVIIVNPDSRVLEEYQLKKSQFEIERSKLKLLKTARATTLDKVKIDLLANIEGAGDVTAALEAGAEGVGLYRTEFLCLGRGDMPGEEEQFEAYRKAVKGMEGRPITIRTFDLGNDKNMHLEDAFDYRKRPNPALGLRSIRLSLADPKSFQIQLRAILRASKFGKVKLLIPMLSHAHQIDQTLAALEQAKSSLRGDRIAFDDSMEIGGMIEIPAAALAVGLFLRRLNFISIGTNDLIQYTLAIDRSDEQISHLYDPLHPAVLMLLSHVISSADKANIPVSMCGEMAGDPNLTRLLLGMGLRQFSMFPAQIPEVKQKIKQSDISELEPVVRRLLRLEESVKIHEQIDRLNV
jgi:phosphotransferase system enzyme I (PtsI)